MFFIFILFIINIIFVKKYFSLKLSAHYVVYKVYKVYTLIIRNLE